MKFLIYLNQLLHKTTGLRIDRQVLESSCGVIGNIRLLFFLGRAELVSMFGATSFGAFWQPISLGVTIFGIAVIFGNLFNNTGWDRYVPFICASMILWSMLSSTLNELTECFSQSQSHITTRYHDLIIFPARAWSKNVLQLVLNLPIMAVVIIIFEVEFSIISLVSLLYGLFTFIVSIFSLGLIFSIFGSKFTDFGNVVKNALQILFFLTPVMWQTENFKHKWLYEYNPLYHLLELVRKPLLDGQEVVWYTYFWGTLIMLSLGIIALLFWSIFSWRIHYHTR